MLTGEFAGRWWTPDAPRKKFGGVLKLVPGEQPKLHVMGVMSDLQRRLGSVAVEHPVVLGMTALGKPVTLLSAYESGGEMNLFVPGAGDTVITAPLAYIGGHYRRGEDATFRSIVMDLSSLSSWFPPPAIRRKLDAPGGHLAKAVLTYKPEPQVDVDLPFGSLAFGHEFRSSGNLRTDARFAQSANVVATTRRKRPVDWWLKAVVKPLRHLLSLATEQPVEVESLRLRPRASSNGGEVEVVWANEVLRRSRRELHPHEMLFWYGDLEARFAAAMEDWFAAVEKLEDIFDQYFATLNTSRSYVETRFLMIVQAAEAYHRERIGGTRSLVRRVTDLCEHVPEVAQLVLEGSAESFALVVRDARNYRTHIDRRRGAPGAELNLVQLGAQLGVILEAVLLRLELGFDPADIASRMARASRLRRLAIAAGR